MKGRESASAKFEEAADAIVEGDAKALTRLLQANPELIHARSQRQHGATLLHYVAANGVEEHRQKTPKNIVEIAEILLKAGAEVDAEANLYGGGATTLGLAATSVHPERAGVQEALLGKLLEHGASLGKKGAGNGHSLVTGCLANGREKAAKYLAERGAPLDLESAAGVGRLDVVKSYLGADGTLKSNATRMDMQRGFLWACEYGKNEVVEYLLDRGASLTDQAGTGETGLHWAAVGGQVATIRLLLSRGAALEDRNAYGGTALGQALWCVMHSEPGAEYLRTIEELLAAGAKIEEGTIESLRNASGGGELKRRVIEAMRKALEARRT